MRVFLQYAQHKTEMEFQMKKVKDQEQAYRLDQLTNSESADSRPGPGVAVPLVHAAQSPGSRHAYMAPQRATRSVVRQL